jgi:MFS family permease
MSLLGALTPLGQVAETKVVWLKSVIAYTLAGSLSSALVGALLGVVGSWVQKMHWRWLPLLVAAVLAFALAAREWGWIRFSLPERRRQTEKAWAHEFGFVGASALWGFHIGLAFATRFTYGIFWSLAAVIVALGNPLFGVFLMSVYWIARTLPVWLAPRLNWSGPDSSGMAGEIMAASRLYHRLSGVGLMWSGGIAALLAVSRLAGMG